MMEQGGRSTYILNLHRSNDLCKLKLFFEMSVFA